MATIEITNINQRRDDEEEVEDYVVEYRIPGYPNTYRTDPIPAAEFDNEVAKEIVQREASPLVSEPTSEVLLPNETADKTGGSSRRNLLKYGIAGVFSLGMLTAVGTGVYLLTGGGFFQNGANNPNSPISTETAKPAITQTETPTPEQGTPTKSPPATATATPTETPVGTTPAQGNGYRFQFANGPEGWAIGKRVDERSSAGDGKWSGEYGGSLRLNVDGSPSAVQTWRGVDALTEGQTITVEYAPKRFAFSAAGIKLRIVTSNDERIGLDVDNDMSGGGREQDGVLTGTVPRDLSNPEIEIHLVIWPGETSVWIKSVTVE